MKEFDRFPDKKRPSGGFDELTELMRHAQRVQKETGVSQKEATWIPQTEYPTLPIAILLASDIHYGSMGVDYALLEEHFGIVENTPNFFIATNGDHVDNFSPTVLPSGMMENPISPQLQTLAFMDRLKGFDRQAKLAWVGAGNHDDWINAAGYDHYQTFMSEIEAPIFDKGGHVNIVTTGANYRGVFAHQYWGKSKINITNQPKRLIEYEGGGTVDFGWTGHTHQSSYEHFTKGGREMVAVVSGSYKREDPWAAKKGISFQSGLPGIVLMLWQDKKKMEVFKDAGVAQQYMLGRIFDHERPRGQKR